MTEPGAVPSPTPPEYSEPSAGGRLLQNAPLLALVGATETAMERVRQLAADPARVPAHLTAELVKAQAEAQRALAGLHPQRLPAAVSDAAQQAPARLIAGALTAAGRAEASYETFAARGRDVLSRLQQQESTRDVLAQGLATLERGRAAVAALRRMAGEGSGSPTSGAAPAGPVEAGVGAPAPFDPFAEPVFPDEAAAPVVPTAPAVPPVPAAPAPSAETDAAPRARRAGGRAASTGASRSRTAEPAAPAPSGEDLAPGAGPASTDPVVRPARVRRPRTPSAPVTDALPVEPAPGAMPAPATPEE